MKAVLVLAIYAALVMVIGGLLSCLFALDDTDDNS